MKTFLLGYILLLALNTIMLQIAPSDVFWTSLPLTITALGGLAGVIFAGIMGWKKLKEIQKTGVDNHTLLNSNMGIQLTLNARNARRVADLTKNDVDVEAAIEAEGLLAAHVRQQAIVDSGVKTK